MTMIEKKDCTVISKLTETQDKRLRFIADSLGVNKSTILRLLIDLEFERYRRMWTHNKKAIDKDLFQLEKKPKKGRESVI